MNTCMLFTQIDISLIAFGFLGWIAVIVGLLVKFTPKVIPAVFHSIVNVVKLAIKAYDFSYIEKDVKESLKKTNHKPKKFKFSDISHHIGK